MMNSQHFLYFGFVFAGFVVSINSKLNTNYGIPFIEAAAKEGYKAEAHEVITEDGYILVNHRLPYARNSTVENKFPVFIVPGLMGTSDCFILLKNTSLGYVLANNGYDVWLINGRGNKHSNRHVKYDMFKDLAYWNFSLHEMGYYDLSASIDYILNYTKKEKLTGIGHSQGSTSLFLCIAARPEYNDKLNMLVHFAPSVYINDSGAELLNIFGRHALFLDHFLRDILKIHFIPDSWLDGLENFCDGSPGLFFICSRLINFIDYGADVDKVYNNTIFPVVLSHMPSGFCTKVAMHYIQLIQSGLFRNFNYGEPGNIKHYGTVNPPEYDIKLVTVPTALFYSPYDFLIPMNGIKRLKKDLKQPISFEIKYKDFRHITYLFSKYVRVIYPDLLIVLKKYSV